MHTTAAAFLLSLSPLLQSPQEDGRALQPVGEPTWPVIRQIAIDLAAHPDLDWRALDADVYMAPRPGVDRLHVLADDDELARLAALGISWTMVQEDQTAFYQSRLDPSFVAAGAGLGSWLSPPFASGGMGGYYTFNEIVSVLDQMTAAYPAITNNKVSIGTTVQGRTIWMVKISDNPGVDEAEAEVRFDALHHAREPQGMQTTLWLMLYLLENYGTDPLATYLVDNREIYFVPCVNPDGYVYNQSIAPGGGGLWRKNRRNNGGGIFGVDLNRNYPFQWGFDNEGSSPSTDSETYRGPSPASEPETQAMIAFMADRDFRTALSTHTFSDLWLFPFGYNFLTPSNLGDYNELSALQTEVNGYEAGAASSVLYLANGITVDYEHDEHGTMCWTPEIGSADQGFWPATSDIIPLAEENLLAFQRTALGAGAFVYLNDFTIGDLGDADGNFEAGETVSFSLVAANSGNLASSGSVVAALSTTSSDATISDGFYSFGTINAFSQKTTGLMPLRLDILPGTPAGTSIPYVLDLEYEGYVQTFAGSIVVGTRRPFLADDVEIDLGWTAGLSSDTASTGEWEFGNPDGTDSSGEPSHPENDFSSPGVNCFSTGNGGGSAGNDDVDDGLTTLITPRIDLSGVGAASISYARWFANLSTEDDIFLVSISNDDGASWVTLEAVDTNQNQWTEVSFNVPDFLPQTDEMRLRFIAEDDPNNSLVEAAIDELLVEIYDTAPRMNVYGKTETDSPVAVNVTGDSGASYTVFFSPGTGNLTVPGIEGTVLLDLGSSLELFSGSIPSSGLSESIVTIPDVASLVGQTVYLQSLVVGSSLALSNRATIVIE
ncbi:MAG: M14 family zinc carboxypeptidase [Planctomycetota bacterium]